MGLPFGEVWSEPLEGIRRGGKRGPGEEGR